VNIKQKKKLIELYVESLANAITVRECLGIHNDEFVLAGAVAKAYSNALTILNVSENELETAFGEYMEEQANIPWVKKIL